MYAPTAGIVRFDGGEIGGLTANHICHKGIARTFQIPRPFRNLTLLENVALSACFGQTATSRAPAGGRPKRRSRWSACRRSRARRRTGSARRR